jgi:hypothetical protein
MSEPTVTRDFVQNLARNLKARTGAEVRHTDLIADIASALGWRPDALMHSLKQSNPRRDASSGAPSDLASIRPGYERFDARCVETALAAGFSVHRSANGQEFWMRHCGGAESVLVAIGAHADRLKMDASYDARDWKLWLQICDGHDVAKYPIHSTHSGQVLNFHEALDLSRRIVNMDPGKPASLQSRWGMDEAVQYLRDSFHSMFSHARAIAGIDGEGNEEEFFADEHAAHAFSVALHAFPPLDWQMREAPVWNGRVDYPMAESRAPNVAAIKENLIWTVAIGHAAALADYLGCRPSVQDGDRLDEMLLKLVEDYLEFEISRADKPSATMMRR